ncbi:P-loop containing nucleoside triphosphate hydrolase protein [Cladochytrium replicatum]|nr:P-loop containing nucleoside triphosphate hydrolase protein [Cladochytrium replicatum]
MPPRVAIVGVSGCGKSTLAERLADVLGVRFIDSDALYWNDNWVASSHEELRSRLRKALDDSKEGWVIAGNIGWIEDILVPETDLIIWLNYSWWTSFWRLFKRTIARAFTKQTLWGTNCHESFYMTFFTRDSILLWFITSFGKIRKRYTDLILRGQSPFLRKDTIVWVYTQPSDANAFVANVKSGVWKWK